MNDFDFDPPSDKWMDEHKGDYLYTIGRIWECNDDYCDCSEAQIQEIYANKKAPGWIIRNTIWNGKFYTDGEPGAYEELSAKRLEMMLEDPVRASMIRWELEPIESEIPNS